MRIDKTNQLEAGEAVSRNLQIHNNTSSSSDELLLNSVQKWHFSPFWRPVFQVNLG